MSHDFGWALEQMWDGKKARRKAWKPGVYWFNFKLCLGVKEIRGHWPYAGGEDCIISGIKASTARATDWELFVPEPELFELSSELQQLHKRCWHES